MQTLVSLELLFLSLNGPGHMSIWCLIQGITQCTIRLLAVQYTISLLSDLVCDAFLWPEEEGFYILSSHTGLIKMMTYQPFWKQ